MARFLTGECIDQRIRHIPKLTSPDQLLPRPASMSNIWTYWKSHSKQPRLASSIATQDLDVILAEKPAPQASTSSFPAGLSSSANAASNASNKGKGRESPSDIMLEETVDQEGHPENEGDTPIFEGSAAYLLAGGLAGAGTAGCYEQNTMH